MIELFFAIISNYKPFIIFAKKYIVDIWEGAKHATWWTLELKFFEEKTN